MKAANNQDIFERMPVPQAVRTMAIPTIIGQLIVLFYNMADTFFVGRTNNPFMVAGASLILPVFNIPMLFLLNHLLGMYGLVWSQVTADILTVTLSLVVYGHYERRMEGLAKSGKSAC